MECVAVVCPTCGRSIQIDLKKKEKRCEYCDTMVILKRKDILGSDLVQNNMKLSIDSFISQDIRHAINYAKDLMEYMPENAIAQYIMAFDLCYIAEKKNRTSLNSFFQSCVIDELGDDELVDLLRIMRTSLPYLEQFEDDLLIFLFGKEYQHQAILEFLESYLPASIARKATSDWLTDEIADDLQKLMQIYPLPRTMVALGKSLIGLPDSPEKDYEMVGSVRHFLAVYCPKIMKIVHASCEENLRRKIEEGCEHTIKVMQAKFQKQCKSIEQYRRTLGNED